LLRRVLGAFDARPLALFRIALGGVLLEDLACQARGLATFYTDDGLFPRGPRSMPWMWSVLDLTGSRSGVGLLFALGAVVTLAFTLGLFTRLATALTFVFFVSLEHRVPQIHNGGDRMAAVLLFLGLFTDLSGRYALDAWRRGARAEVPGLAPRLMAAVPALLYAQTAIEKLRDAAGGWFDGSVIYANLHLVGWTRAGGVWLRAHPSLCTASGVATILLEIAVPVLFLLPSSIRPARALAVLGYVGVQLGILATLKVAMFTNVMLAATPLWLLPEWLDRVGGVLAAKGARLVTEVALRPSASTAVPALVFAAITFAPLWPAAAMPLLPWAGLDLNVGLFAWAYPSMRWEKAGELEDGVSVDPLPAGADFSDRFANSLWMQLPYRLEAYEPLGRFVCRTYDAGGGAKLRRWSITKVIRPPYRAGEAVPEETRRVMLEAECAAR
jgi:hypothetical protein